MNKQPAKGGHLKARIRRNKNSLESFHKNSKSQMHIQRANKKERLVKKRTNIRPRLDQSEGPKESPNFKNEEHRDRLMVMK